VDVPLEPGHQGLSLSLGLRVGVIKHRSTRTTHHYYNHTYLACSGSILYIITAGVFLHQDPRFD
jgi:hypothetical protein